MFSYLELFVINVEFFNRANLSRLLSHVDKTNATNAINIDLVSHENHLVSTASGDRIKWIL